MENWQVGKAQNNKNKAEQQKQRQAEWEYRNDKSKVCGWHRCRNSWNPTLPSWQGVSVSPGTGSGLMVVQYNQEERHHAQMSEAVYKTNTGPPGGSPTGCSAHPCTFTPYNQENNKVWTAAAAVRPSQTKIMFGLKYYYLCFILSCIGNICNPQNHKRLKKVLKQNLKDYGLRNAKRDLKRKIFFL